MKRLGGSGEGLVKAQKIKEQIERQGLGKVIVLVPEYAARRFPSHVWLFKDRWKDHLSHKTGAM
ncbi:MAG: hypothetical protein MZU91_10585 [Desulfosudis oleivorans]|nr:hypothetical protein [Desulfosudis oleivorans]